MRPDDHGCADLRRSHAAHRKVVRRLTYAPACIRSARAGARAPHGRARALSAALVAGGGVRFTRNAVTAEPTGSAPGTANRPSPPPEPPPPMAGTVPRTSPHGGPYGPDYRNVNSCHWHEQLPNGRPLPLDDTSRAELPGIRGCAGALHGGQDNGHCGNSRLIGALTYDTYARAAAPVTHGGGPRAWTCGHARVTGPRSRNGCSYRSTRRCTSDSTWARRPGCWASAAAPGWPC